MEYKTYEYESEKKEVVFIFLFDLWGLTIKSFLKHPKYVPFFVW